MSGNYFLQRGNVFSLTNKTQTVVHDQLPLGFYDACLDPMMGYFLTVKDDVKALPKKLYGTINQRCDRILRTYNERLDQNLQTGVLLSGEKGSGKSLLAMLLAHRCGLPVVFVSNPYSGKAFFDMLVTGGRKLVLFDEFEKVYDKSTVQQELLTMLDGTYPTKNLTVATLNDHMRVADAMKNRPTRFYYHYRYVGLDRAFIDDYCKDRLKNYNDEIMELMHGSISRVTGFNFDMLQAMVEEMNRFNEKPDEVLRHLNVIPTSLNYNYDVTAFNSVTGKEIELKNSKVSVAGFLAESMQFALHPKPLNAKEKKNGVRGIYVYGSQHYRGTAEGGTLIFEISREEFGDDDNQDYGVIVKAKREGAPREWTV